MKQITRGVTSLSRALDKLAGLCMVATMLLVVANVLLRALFKHPILGAFEYVGYLTALMIGFALAHCAVQKAHIAVGFVVDKLPAKIQATIDIIMHSMATAFWFAATWHMIQHGHKLMLSGAVSATAQIPLYPFVYTVALSLFTLGLVVLMQLITSITQLTAGNAATAVTVNNLTMAAAKVNPQMASAHRASAK